MKYLHFLAIIAIYNIVFYITLSRARHCNSYSLVTFLCKLKTVVTVALNLTNSNAAACEKIEHICIDRYETCYANLELILGDTSA